jgi:lysophospholipase L1-like esterase
MAPEANAKTILCYGDSNTWGTDPASGTRLPAAQRWPGAMADALGAGYRIIEEGLPGRTTVFEHRYREGLNGRTYLGPCLNSHAPLDLVIIMLGTNDMDASYNAGVLSVAGGAGLLAGMAKAFADVLLVAPPPLQPMPDLLAAEFEGGHDKSRRLPEALRDTAADLGVHFFDASEVARFSEIDGLHLDAENSIALGRALAARVRDILS